MHRLAPDAEARGPVACMVAENVRGINIVGRNGGMFGVISMLNRGLVVHGQMFATLWGKVESFVLS